MTPAQIADNRADLLNFTRTMFRARKGADMIPAAHHPLICNALERVVIGKTKRLIINIPPRSGKTELAAISFMSWCMGNWPDSEFIHASYSKRLATANAYNVRAMMMNETYAKIFDHTALAGDSKAKDEFRTAQGGIVYATGAEGTITGYGAGKMRDTFGGAILIDDPHKAGEALSDTMRQNVIDWFQTTIESRKNSPDTPIIIIMQRLHESDLAGWLLDGGNGEEWEHLNIPAINHAGESFWPEQFPLEMLHRLEKASPYIYAGQYLQRPTPVGGGDFKPAMIQIVSEAPRKLRWVRGWDLAATTKKTSDFTASARLAVDADGIIWIDGIQNERESPDGVERMMIQTAQLDGRETMHSIPQDPGQAGVAQKSNLSRKLAGQDFEFTPETGDKRSRAMPFAAQVNAGNVRIVDGPNVKAYLHQLESFPVGKHDDMIDASSRAYNKLISETTAAGLMIPKRLRR